MFNQNFLDALNLLNIYSVYLAILNLEENRQQSAQNDVNAANEREARYILEEIGKRLDAQDAVIKEILEVVKGENADRKEP